MIVSFLSFAKKIYFKLLQQEKPTHNHSLTMSPTFIHPIYIIILIIINIQKCYTLNNNITNLTTLTPTLAPTLSPTNITTTIIPTISPSKSPSKSPSTSPSISPSKSPSKAPTKSPSKSPSISPSISPTKSTTYKPTNNPTKTKFTTTNGKSINPTQQLLVNFTLNFTSSKESTTYTMDESLKLAYSYVGIPANYIQNYQYPLHIEIYYFYKIYSVINAKDKAQATDYQALIASDPETGSLFRDTLKEILLDNETNQHFDMSTIYMDGMYYYAYPCTQ